MITREGTTIAFDARLAAQGTTFNHYITVINEPSFPASCNNFLFAENAVFLNKNEINIISNWRLAR